MRKKYVMDACSLIAYFNEEEGFEKVRAVMVEAANGDADALIHRVNLFEVYYDLYRTGGADMTTAAMDTLKESPIFIEDMISDEMMVEAARFKLSYKISVADSFALAMTKLENATLVTADRHEFSAIDDANEIQILWFR